MTATPKPKTKTKPKAKVLRAKVKKPAKRPVRKAPIARAAKSRPVAAPVQQQAVIRRDGPPPAIRSYAIHNGVVLATAVAVLAVLSGSVAWVAVHNPTAAIANRHEPQAAIDAKADPTIAVTVEMAIQRKSDEKIDAKTASKIDDKIVAMIDAQVAASRDEGTVPLIVDGVRARPPAGPAAVAQQPAAKPAAAQETGRRSRTPRRSAPNAARNAGQDEPVARSFASASLDTTGIIAEARRYLGTNPTGRAHDWCGAFLDMVLKRTGHRGGGNLARAYAAYGTRIAGPAVGAIAVFTRRGGGHVGIVTGIDSNGNPIVISGNHNHRVAESTYPARRAIAYVMPGG